jgi:hypothetical protein
VLAALSMRPETAHESFAASSEWPFFLAGVAKLPVLAIKYGPATWLALIQISTALPAA